MPARVYGAAAILTPMMIPYTLMFISPINAKLNGLASIAAQDSGRVDGTEVQALLQTWKRLNYVRSAIVMFASGVGIFGTLVWKL